MVVYNLSYKVYVSILDNTVTTLRYVFSEMKHRQSFFKRRGWKFAAIFRHLRHEALAEFYPLWL